MSSFLGLCIQESSLFMGHVLKKWQHKDDGVGGRGVSGGCILTEVTFVYSWSLLGSCRNSLFVPVLASLVLGQSAFAERVHK